MTDSGARRVRTERRAAKAEAEETHMYLQNNVGSSFVGTLKQLLLNVHGVKHIHPKFCHFSNRMVRGATCKVGANVLTIES